jgi:Tol biopolymer transport system component
VATLAAILNREPEPVEQVVVEIPREVSRIVRRCLRKDPQRRAQSITDLKLALEEVKEESESGALAAPAAVQRVRKGGWAAALVALAALAGTVFWFLHNNQKPQAPLYAVPLTAYPGAEQHASFSPDGRQVAFSWSGEKQGNVDIYVKLIGSGRPLRLTTDPAADMAPAWSPDGASIAFLRRQGDKAKIMLIPALGGAEREIGELLESFWVLPSVNWSPNGQWLVVTGRDSVEKPAALWLVSPESGAKRQLTSPPASNAGGDSSGTFSPDGRAIAFARATGLQASDLYVLQLAGDLTATGEARRLTKDKRFMFGIAWAANGREIVFSSNRGGTQALWRIAISVPAEPQRLSIGENGIFPAISTRGDRLVYSQSVTDSNIWRVNLSDPREPPRQLIASTRVDNNPQYSPDGKKIAFESSRSANQEVWVCDADGSNAVQLVAIGRSGSPRWSPDGQHIAFDSNVNGSWQIYTVGAQGGKPQRMTRSTANDNTPSWSQDGSWIYFASDRTGGSEPWQIWKIPSGGGDPVQVTRQGGYCPFESQDGKTIYHGKSHSFSAPLWKVPSAGGEESQVLDSVNSAAYAATRSGIYFVSNRHLYYFNFSSGTSKPILTLEKGPSAGVSVSPDEHWLLYSQFDQSGSDLMLVENFR